MCQKIQRVVNIVAHARGQRGWSAKITACRSSIVGFLMGTGAEKGSERLQRMNVSCSHAHTDQWKRDESLSVNWNEKVCDGCSLHANMYNLRMDPGESMLDRVTGEGLRSATTASRYPSASREMERVEGLLGIIAKMHQQRVLV